METFVKFINNYQIAIAIWFFIRDMKFFRLFYVFFNSFFHNGLSESFPKERDHMVLIHSSSDLYCGKNIEEEEGMGRFSKHMSRGNVFYSFYPPVYKKESKTFLSKIVEPFMSPRERARVLLNPVAKDEVDFWLKNAPVMRVIKTKDYLIRGTFLCQVATDQDVIEHVLGGGAFLVSRFRSVIDQSGDSDLNRNFTKFIQIIPPFLQAQGLKEYSAAFFLFYYIMDFFNKGINKIWQLAKFYIIDWVKNIINSLPIYYRKEIIGVLSSSTDKFLYCDKAMFKSYKRSLKSVVISENLAHADLEFEPEDLNNTLTPFNEGFWKFSPNVGERIEVINFKINGFKHHLQIVYDGSGLNHLDRYYSPEFNLSLTTDYGENWSDSKVHRTRVHLIIHFLRTLEVNDQFPCTAVKNSYMHVETPVDCIKKNKFRFLTLLKLDKETVFKVSQYEIGFSADILSFLNSLKKAYSSECLKKAIHHNFLYWGKIEISPMLRCLETGNGARYFKSYPNKKWKKYVSDLDLILLKYNGSCLKSLDKFPPTKHYWKTVNSGCTLSEEILGFLEERETDLLQKRFKKSKKKEVNRDLKLDCFYKALNGASLLKKKEKEEGKGGKKMAFFKKLNDIYNIKRKETIRVLKGDSEPLKSNAKLLKEKIKLARREMYRETVSYREELILKRVFEKSRRPKEFDFTKCKTLFNGVGKELEEVFKKVKRNGRNNKERIESLTNETSRCVRDKLNLKNIYECLRVEQSGVIKKSSALAMMKGVKTAMDSGEGLSEIREILKDIEVESRVLRAMRNSLKAGEIILKKSPEEHYDKEDIDSDVKPLRQEIVVEKDLTEKIKNFYSSLKKSKKRYSHFQEKIFDSLKNGEREINVNSVIREIYSFRALKWAFKDIGLETFVKDGSKKILIKNRKKIKKMFYTMLHDYIKEGVKKGKINVDHAEGIAFLNLESVKFKFSYCSSIMEKEKEDIFLPAEGIKRIVEVLSASKEGKRQEEENGGKGEEIGNSELLRKMAKVCSSPLFKRPEESINLSLVNNIKREIKNWEDLRGKVKSIEKENFEIKCFIRELKEKIKLVVLEMIKKEKEEKEEMRRKCSLCEDEIIGNEGNDDDFFSIIN